MYTIFSDRIHYIDGEWVLCDVKTFPEGFEDLVDRREWHIFDAKVYPRNPKGKFELWLNPKFTLFDFAYVSSGYDLYSPILTQLLQSNGVDFETFETVFVNSVDGSLIENVNHSVFNLLEIDSCIDLENSITKAPANPYFVEFEKISLRRELFVQEPLLVRDSEFSNFVFAHNKLQKLIMDERITGCAFKQLDFSAVTYT